MLSNYNNKKGRRLRLCFFAPGRSIHTSRWISAFAEYSNFQITLISTYDALPDQPFPESVRFILIRPPSPTLPALMRFLRVVCNYSAMRRFVIQQKFDLFHIHQVPPARTAFFFHNIPRLILSPWGTDITRIRDSLTDRFFTLSQRYLIKNAKAITTASGFLANATRRFASPGTPIHVIPFGVNSDKFKNEGTSRNWSPVRIAVAKSLERRYGLSYLLDALAQIRNVRHDVALTIAGSGSIENALRNQTYSQGDQDDHRVRNP